MIRQQHEAVCPEQYLTAIGVDPEKAIYFDIETTGLRASTSQLYMIGWAVRQRETVTDQDTAAQETDDQEAADLETDELEAEGFSGCDSAWITVQLMAEKYAEETLLLKIFADVLAQYDTIIEFNGDRFDLPYLQEKYAHYGMPDPFEGLSTVDLYQQIRPCRTLLGMSRLNQKSVEQFLRITREDPYNGGQLIDVYRGVRSHSCTDIDTSIRALFLHNYEDVIGMMAMTPILSYPMTCCCSAPVVWKILDADGNPVCGNISQGSFLECSFRIAVPVPRDIETDMGVYRIDITGDTVTVTIPLIQRTLYHFFPNYRDYYYLPEEDTAIHKSVACFVDPAFRRKATAQNCYVKKEGIFLPQTEERFQPTFRISCRDIVSWFELKQELLDDQEAFSAYVHSLL